MRREIAEGHQVASHSWSHPVRGRVGGARGMTLRPTPSPAGPRDPHLRASGAADQLPRRGPHEDRGPHARLHAPAVRCVAGGGAHRIAQRAHPTVTRLVRRRCRDRDQGRGQGDRDVGRGQQRLGCHGHLSLPVVRGGARGWRGDGGAPASPVVHTGAQLSPPAQAVYNAASTTTSHIVLNHDTVLETGTTSLPWILGCGAPAVGAARRRSTAPAPPPARGCPRAASRPSPSASAWACRVPRR